MSNKLERELKAVCRELAGEVTAWATADVSHIKHGIDHRALAIANKAFELLKKLDEQQEA